MLSIEVFLFTIILCLIIGYILYIKNYKKEAILIRNGVYGFTIFYIVFVLFIGIIPIK